MTATLAAAAQQIDLRNIQYDEKKQRAAVAQITEAIKAKKTVTVKCAGEPDAVVSRAKIGRTPITKTAELQVSDKGQSFFYRVYDWMSIEING